MTDHSPLDAEHSGIDREGHVEMVDLPFEDYPLDPKLCGQIECSPDEVKAGVADILSAIFVDVVKHKNGKMRPARAITIRWLVLLAYLRPDLFDDISGKELAKFIGCGKANITGHALALAKSFNLNKFARSRDVEGRKAMRDARFKQLSRNEKEP